MSAAEVAASGIPEDVIVDKFGLRGKHIAGDDEHVSDLAVTAASRLLEDLQARSRRDRRGHVLRLDLEGLSSLASGPVDRAPLGCRRAHAVEYDNVSMGTPVALRLARALLVAEPELRNVLVVAACRESYLLDYRNERSRFMFNFGDGAVAGLLVSDLSRNRLLASHALTDGSFALQVKVPAGGSVQPASEASVRARRHWTSPTRRR